ncbi:hypothetical protein F7Q99_36285 [Streptomyces kaniharaensis]|uniref:Uncharacterized protein n=1 Tax=Streptomyces kaniharaensis TaxID=212423 RepID=A0A6N7L0Y0_9ACTN|nr:hypothetical protein [Streptomyces kaniharaensis]MQS17502.1 hypothetical protein [Streptomyces kaniharaensis]
MSEMDDLRARLAAVEAELDRLREESAATRTMAAMADRDSAEVRSSLRGHTQVLNAIREDQLEQRRATAQLAEAVGVLVAGQGEQTRVLAEHGAALAEHTRILESQGRALEAQGKALEGVLAGQAAILEELRRQGGK